MLSRQSLDFIETGSDSESADSPRHALPLQILKQFLGAIRGPCLMKEKQINAIGP
jgi:hypothetical protein